MLRSIRRTTDLQSLEGEFYGKGSAQHQLLATGLSVRRRHNRGLKQKHSVESPSGSPVSTRPAFFLQKDLESPGTGSAFVGFCITEWSEQ